MGYDGSLKFDTSINENGFNKGLKNLGSIAAKGMAVLAGAVAGVATAMGTGIALGVKYNASIEQYQTSFEVMTGSADKAAEVREILKKVGAETPFELPELADTTQLLMNYGFTADDAMDKMMMLGDISQGSADKMSRIATAYGQMSSAGKVSLEDVKQMIEAGFNPLQEISESTGESMASLYKRISKGTLSVDEITASMERATSEGGKYFKSMEKQSQTVNGLISTLKDNAQQLLGEVVKPISESMAKKLLPSAINAMEQLTTAFQTEGVDGLIQAGGQILSNLLLGISQKIPTAITTAVGVITTFINSITANIPQFLSAGGQIISSLLSGMMQLLPSIGTFAITLVTQLYEQITAQAPVLLQKGYELLNNLITGFVEAIPEALPKVLDFIQGIGNKLAEAAPVMIKKGFDLLGKLVEGIVQAIPILIAKVPTIISTFANVINDNFPTILAKGVGLLWELIKGIISAIPDLIANIPKIISAIVDTLMAFQWLSLGRNIIKLLKDGIMGMVGAVKSAGIKIFDTIRNTMINLPSTLSNLGKSAIYNLSSTISGLASSAKTAALKVASAIETAILKLPGKMLSIGKNIVKGLWNGISGMVGWITDKVMGFANSVLGGIKKALGIHSPSRVMRDQVGKMMALGMGIGFEKNIPETDMEKQLGKTVNKLKAGANSVFKVSGIKTTEQIVKNITNNYTGETANYKKVESAVLRALNKANKKPIILNGRNLRRGLNDGGIVLA